MSSITLMLAMMVPSWATTWTVTSGMSIQSAINGATTGDTIEVEAGTYVECLNPNGRDLSIQGVGSVLINGNSCSATITVANSEGLQLMDLELQNTSGLVLEVTSGNANVSLSNINVSSSGYSSQGSSSLGGVIYTEGAVLIDGSNFSSNTGGLGGVIYADGGSVTILNSIFTGNSALKGGVVYAKDGTLVTSSNNTYENNWTVNGGFGGVFAFSFGVDFVEDGSVFENNVSDSNGGVVYANHNFASSQGNIISISNAFFDTNQAGNGSFTTGSGGALYIYNRSTITIHNSEFQDNTASNGGAIWAVASNDTVTITDSSFTQNTADSSGAIGVLASGSSAPTNLEMSNTSFTSNEATSGFGGAVTLGSTTISQSFGTLTIQNSLFEFNEAQNSSSAHGGAILVNTDSSSDISIVDTLFQENAADSSGGALYFTGAETIDISRSWFVENEASSPASYERFGGAVSLYNAEEVSLDNLIFCGNEVTQFPNMTASGGGVYLGDVDEVAMHNIIFQENSSDESGGALAISDVDDISLINNTFVGNIGTQGDAVWASNSPVEMINNIFAFSTGSSAVHAADAASASNGSVYGNWFGNSSDNSGSFVFSVTSNGNLVDDPQFVQYSQDGDCDNDSLLLDSSTINALIDGGDPLRFDLDGTRSDIGAFGGSGLIDGDGDGFGALVDCDDSNSSTYPGAAFLESTTACMLDSDGDGYGELSPSNPLVQIGQDCDDSDFNTKPGAPEFCDGLDNDCNNQIDDNPVSGTTYFQDSDNDGFGGTTTVVSCNAVNGTSSLSGDCDDLDPFAYPGAAPLDSVTLCMRDLDGDGYGDSAPSNPALSSGTDCDDAQAAFSPAANEMAADGQDQNCDSYEDCFVDGDLDGFGSSAITSSASLACSGLAISDNQDDCDDADANTFPGAAEYDSSTACMTDADQDGYGWMIAPANGVGGNDCDDTDSAVYYGAPEIPGDGVSQDCDNNEDCFTDSDGDGYGSSLIQVSTDLDCTDSGESSNSDDCDDSDPEIFPGAEEVPYDEIDQDCDPATLDDDLDGDGYGISDGDCDDADPERNPGQEDIPGDGIDQDCDGEDATEEDTGDTDDPDDTGDTDDTEVDPDTDTGVPGDGIDKDGGCSTMSMSQFGLWAMLGVFFPRRRKK